MVCLPLSTTYFRTNPLTLIFPRHIMTGIGAYLYIVWGIWLRHCLNQRQDEYHLRWAHFWHIPEVVRTTPGSENGVARDKKST